MHKIHSKTTLLVMVLSFTSIFAGDNEPAPRITAKTPTSPVIAGITATRVASGSRQITSPTYSATGHRLTNAARRLLVPPVPRLT